MKVLVTLLIMVLFFLVLMFCIENMGQQVTLHFFKYHSPPMPVFLVALLSTLAGVLLTGVVTLIEGIKLRVRNAQMARRIRKLEAEVDALRNQALGPAPAAPPPVGEEPPGAEPAAPPTLYL